MCVLSERKRSQENRTHDSGNVMIAFLSYSSEFQTCILLHLLVSWFGSLSKSVVTVVALVCSCIFYFSGRKILLLILEKETSKSLKGQGDREKTTEKNTVSVSDLRFVSSWKVFERHGRKKEYITNWSQCLLCLLFFSSHHNLLILIPLTYSFYWSLCLCIFFCSMLLHRSDFLSSPQKAFSFVTCILFNKKRRERRRFFLPLEYALSSTQYHLTNLLPSTLMPLPLFPHDMYLSSEKRRKQQPLRGLEDFSGHLITLLNNFHDIQNLHLEKKREQLESTSSGGNNFLHFSF